MPMSVQNHRGAPMRDIKKTGCEREMSKESIHMRHPYRRMREMERQQRNVTHECRMKREEGRRSQPHPNVYIELMVERRRSVNRERRRRKECATLHPEKRRGNEKRP